MENKRRYRIKHILITTLWVCIGACLVVLLAASIRKKDAKKCRGIEVTISGVSNNYFVDKSDVLNIITNLVNGQPIGKAIGSFDLKQMEAALEKNTWIQQAELFFDNTEILRINVQEREPIARIFSSTGTTFYIDENIAMLPLSEKFSARLPVFTNFPSDRNVLAAIDSNLLRDIKKLSIAIQQDSFCMAMIEQVDITTQRTFEMIPKIGNQLIVFGDATDINEKLNKLRVFYKKVMVKAGWNNYSVINLQYKNQVVAKIRGAEDVRTDSLRTMQLIAMIADNAEKMAADSIRINAADNENTSIDSSMIQNSIQRDDNTEQSNIPENAPSIDKQVNQPVLNSVDPKKVKKETKSNVIPVEKPTPAVIKKNTLKPKAIMPKKNDY